MPKLTIRNLLSERTLYLMTGLAPDNESARALELTEQRLIAGI